MAKYLIDTNCLITPYKLYYAFDIAPLYWEKLNMVISSGEIAILDMVRDEIARVRDSLRDWLVSACGNPVSHKDAAAIAKYADILNYIRTCGFYKDTAFHEWSLSDAADPWLIAASSAYGYTIVTLEESRGSLSSRQKSSRAKIPEVAKAFGVRTIDLFQMMRELEIRLE